MNEWGEKKMNRGPKNEKEKEAGQSLSSFSPFSFLSLPAAASCFVAVLTWN